jgi:hypothetical protein
MVVSQLLGGLGNQLFQYAVGRALAEKTNSDLHIDTSEFRTYTLRPYKLGHFNIRAHELGLDDRKSLRLPYAGEPLLSRSIRKMLGSRLRVIRERSFEFDPLILQSSGDSYLQGYWQSPKYFAEIEGQIRVELTIRSPMSTSNHAIAQRISEALSASVHVRRGDYASNPVTRDYHGLCDADYYRRAQERLVDLVGPVTFYVFSDDPAWVRENLRFICKAEIVDHNGPDRDYEDLRLMSLCRHHIIANSTFSWWGAWLSPHADKKVVAPKNWFKGAPQSADDLVPSDWLRL